MNSHVLSQQTLQCTLCLCIPLLAFLLYTSDICEQDCKLSRNNSNDPQQPAQRVAWLTGATSTRTLQHVRQVLQTMGVHVTTSQPEHVHLLWSHHYPYVSNRTQLAAMDSTQWVNHVPGIAHLTAKSELHSVTGADYLPVTFRIPQDVRRLREYHTERQRQRNTAGDSAAGGELLYIQKQDTHRGVRVATYDQLDLTANRTLVQQFIDSPLLVDGYMFDVGVYVLLTSVQPLRVYMYTGDVLLRFCREPYQWPINASTPASQFVIGGNYRPLWRVPSLAYLYRAQRLGFRAALDTHMRLNMRLDPDIVWRRIETIIGAVFGAKQRHLVASLARFRGARAHTVRMFELVRFDFVIDQQLCVHLLEVNMSPNLSSAYLEQNAWLYEQLLHSTFSLLGVTAPPRADHLLARDTQHWALGPLCVTHCSSSCEHVCRLCAPCGDTDLQRVLRDSWREHAHRHHYRLLVPPVTRFHTHNYARDIVDNYRWQHPAMENMTEADKILLYWYMAACVRAPSWCY